MTQILDHGYITLVDNMGSDLTIVNAARVSFDKEASELTEKDERLIDYLIQHKHDSTLRHCVMTFEVYAPLMVARQWYKHAVGSAHLEEQFGWNETSRRYITENEEFYIPSPNAWRSAAENRKQGSSHPVDISIGAEYTQTLRKLVQEGYTAYQEALEAGIAPEQARLMLPANALYVRWRWTVSLNGALHFLALRLDNNAQWEIQQYAKAMEDLMLPYYPMAIRAFREYRL